MRTSAVLISWCIASLLAGCAGDADQGATPDAGATSAAVTSTIAPESATTAPTPTTDAAVSTAATSTAATNAPATNAPATNGPTTTVPAPVYVFPFAGRNVSYGTTHHDYPAVDVFGCGADVVAPTSGVVLETSTVDRWDPAVNDPATRGGLFVSMLGDDGVRYYVAHLASVAVAPDQTLAPGDPLGVMGETGNARNSECHTHLGISWPCPEQEWQVRRGMIWPQQYLDAWRTGEQRSPALEIFATATAAPTACDEAAALVAPTG